MAHTVGAKSSAATPTRNRILRITPVSISLPASCSLQKSRLKAAPTGWGVPILSVGAAFSRDKDVHDALGNSGSDETMLWLRYSFSKKQRDSTTVKIIYHLALSIWHCTSQISHPKHQISGCQVSGVGGNSGTRCQVSGANLEDSGVRCHSGTRCQVSGVRKKKNKN